MSHVLYKMKRPKATEAKESEVDAQESKGLDAKYESDVSVPDGFSATPGSTVRKTWRIKNTGGVAWPEGTMLVWTQGKIKARDETRGVPASCEAGCSTDISVDVLIPFKPGRHRGNFRLVTASGEQFGDNYFIDVNVTREEFKAAKHTQKQAAKQAVKSAKQAAKSAKQAAKAAKHAAKRELRSTKQAFNKLRKNARKQQNRAKEPKVKAEFVEDISIADGSVLDSGASLQKIWRLKNTGECAWPEGTELVFVRGDFVAEAKSVPVACEAGATVDVGIDLIAPSEPGRARAFFRLALPCGRKLPLKLWLESMIAPPSSSDEDNEAVSYTAVPVEGLAAINLVDPITEEEADKIAHLHALGRNFDGDMLLSLLRAADGDELVVRGWLTGNA